MLENLGYCTSYDTFKHLYDDETYKLAIMNGCYMNDPLEGVTLTNYLGITKKHIKSSHIYLKSFSVAEETLPMWNGYGDKGKGVFVEVDKSFFDGLAKSPLNMKLCRMVYISEDGTEITVTTRDDESEQITKDIKQLYENLKLYVDDAWKNYEYIVEEEQQKRKDDLKNLILDCMNDSLRLIRYLCKYDISAYEKEVRIVYEDDGTSELRELPGGEDKYPKMAVMSPVPMALKRIVLGPCFEQPFKAIPYIATKAIGMYPENMDKKHFRREGVCMSRLSGMICE